ncbi:hypothetical protein KOW79_006851 [Hemibagrus wyckioides]|uniref:Uncharacterized protein n=1 Tax=Hemibagrus wyckioides TaxID=337641 RepID=A0A9D3NYS8_9TELE|nr:hypothetical protein KOW79_006851 [Hemibagrus wyckioides]
MPNHTEPMRSTGNECPLRSTNTAYAFSYAFIAARLDTIAPAAPGSQPHSVHTTANNNTAGAPRTTPTSTTESAVQQSQGTVPMGQSETLLQSPYGRRSASQMRQTLHRGPSTASLTFSSLP